MSVTAIHAARLEKEYLESLAQRVGAWRLREGKSYFSMPTPLWDEAVAAARKYGPRQVARDLGLNRDELKRRVALASGAAHPAATQAALKEEALFCEMPGVAAALAAAVPAQAAPPSVQATPPAQAPQAVQAEPPAAADADTYGEDDGAAAAAHSLLAAVRHEATVEVIAPNGSQLIVRVPMAQFDLNDLVLKFRGAA